jgi:hypothetical protein
MGHQSALLSEFQPSQHLHLPVDADECPSCGQTIPPEKLEEIKGKIALKERERTLAITDTLQNQFAQERAALESNHRLQMDEWQQSISIATAGRRAAEEEVRKAKEDNLAAIEAATVAAKEQAERVAADERIELERKHGEVDTAFRAELTAAQASVEEAKAATQTAVDTAVAEKLAEAQRQHSEKEADLETKLRAAQTATDEAKAATEQAVSEAVTKRLAEAEEKHSEKESTLLAQVTAAQAAVKEAKESTEALVAERVAESNRIHAESERSLKLKVEEAEAAAAQTAEAVTAANQRLTEVQGQVKALKEQQAEDLRKRLEEQREALELDKQTSLNAQAAKSFEENQKLATKVNELTRALEKKSNEELGEGAEVDLYEALKQEFPGDKITRVKRGEPGGDVIHIVRQNGRECGKIIYDSKNHKAFRTDHVSKLKIDQIAAGAEHAILSTHKFPQGTGQLHMMDGVLLANPARVVMLATVVRRHIIHVHSLRLSGLERDSKTEQLYNFITSERCAQLFERIDGRAKELLDLQVSEKRAHDKIWKKQGETLRAIQKANSEIELEIGTIVGKAVASDHDGDCLQESSEALEA